MHAVARCPYHVDAEELRLSNQDFAFCAVCRRTFPIQDGVYRLMPDELRDAGGSTADATSAVRQMADEMRQRDERASRSSLFRREPAGSPLFWMNIQFDAVARLAAVGRGEIGVDFGTGVGRYVPWLLERFERVVAIDFSFESLRALRSSLSLDQQDRCLFLQCDMSRLALAPGSAHGGLCVEVLQHVPESSLRGDAVAGMARTLSAGAIVCLVTNAFALVRRMTGAPQVRHDGAVYSYWHTYRELRAMVEPYFDVLAARGIISYDTFPIRKLPRALRMRADGLLEKCALGRLFGRDFLLNLRRKAS